MPELREGQAIIKMEMCGICGSDVTAYRGVNPTMRYPINGLGHEGVGVIQEIGENDKGLKPGSSSMVGTGPSHFLTRRVPCLSLMI